MLATGNPDGVLMILSGVIGLVGAIVSEQLAGAAGTAMLGIQAIAIGLKCIKCCTPYGLIALAVGAACVAFATAEAQEALGYGNWMKDGLGLSDGWYTGLMVTANIAAIAINLVGVKQCFKAGTLVQTEEGLKPIEEIQVGDKVLAYDEETGVQAYKKVLRLFRNTSQDWTGVTVNGEEIISTPKHKYYLPESKSWKSAEELKVGTKVLLTDGSYGIIEAVKAIHYDEPETTYNFEVEDFHTYYVGTGVLVHNKGCGVDLYRGGNDMTLKKGEYAIKDGLVVPGKDGVSVNLNPAEVARFGTPYKIVNVPEGLTIAQKGLNPAHYVIRPTYAMPLNQYQSLLYQVKLIPYI